MLLLALAAALRDMLSEVLGDALRVDVMLIVSDVLGVVLMEAPVDSDAVGVVDGCADTDID